MANKPKPEESDEDKLDRLRMMVDDDGGTWDLSDNDKAAIAWAVERIESADAIRPRLTD